MNLKASKISPLKLKSLLLLCAFCLCLMGCERKVSLQDPYNESSLETDLKYLEEEKKLNLADLKLLSVYILYKKMLDNKIGQKTYADLLLEAKATQQKKVKPFETVFGRLEKMNYDEVLGNALAISESDSLISLKRKELQQLDEKFAREQDKILAEMETDKKNKTNTRREFSNNLEDDDSDMVGNVSTKTRKALSVTLQKKQVQKLPNDQTDVQYLFKITNNTAKKIRVVVGKVDVIDERIENITSFAIECNKEIKANQTIEWKYTARYSTLSETYKKLEKINTPKIIWNPQKIFFTDGAIWQ